MKLKSIELTNFRSYEKCTISFEDYYTAICGRNNSGKSNIIKAILNLFGQASFRNRINYHNDFPIWKNKETKENIVIKGNLQLDKCFDLGLIKFLNVFLNKSLKLTDEIEIADTKISIELNIAPNSRDNFSIITVNDKIIDDKYNVSEILRRIQFSQSIIFHNSTQQTSNFRATNHGHVENIPQKLKESIESKIVTINKDLNKAIQKHKTELQLLMGRLEEKYEVGLNFTGLDINYEKIPYEISLGEKNMEMPLEEWGSGTKNRTLILSSIFNAKSQIGEDGENYNTTPIIIVEEPESFLHPSAQSEFGRILQDLSNELEIQVITTTHSPYMLSHHNPKSNLLISRNVIKNKVRNSLIEDINNENWTEPFELALGMVGPEFESLKDAFFSRENNIVLVEGEIDVRYFNLLKNNKHGDKKLNFSGELYPYGGFGFLNNPVLLKFMKERFNKLIITLDLDALPNVKSNLDKAGLVKDIDYFTIGIDKPGYRCMEGLVPNFIKSKVNNENEDLVFALQSEEKEERKSAKDKLKNKYLEEFEKNLKYDDIHFKDFYELTTRINKKLK